MKVKLSDWLVQASGSMGEKYYAVPCKDEPGWVVLKKKPGPRNPRGKRKNLWVMPENQAKGVRSFTELQRRASAIYHDAAQRAVYEAEYLQWKEGQRKHSRPMTIYKGKHCLRLWDWIKIRLKEGEQQ